MLRRNVLIFHQAALGDFIVTWPLAMALSRIMPQSRIIYVTHSQKGKLAERALRVESADAEGGWHSLLSDSPKLPDAASKLLDAAQVVMSFTAGGTDRFCDALSRVVPEARVISLDTRRPGAGHVTESLLEQLRGSVVLSTAMEQMLRSVASRGVGYARTPQGCVVIHPGAGKEANRWPAERFLELISRLRGGGKQVRVLLGEVEQEKWPRELIRQFESVAEVRRPSTLLQLLDEIAAAAAFVGNDSGPGHLAGIIGVPTLALFGPSDPARWRPLGPTVRTLRGEPITEIPLDSVYTELSHLIGG